MSSIRAKFYYYIKHSDTKKGLSFFIDVFIMALIILSVVLVLVESVPAYFEAHYQVLHFLDIVTIVVFTLEYFIRLWTIVEEKKFSDGWRGRLRWMFTPMAIIDFLSFFPFYLIFLPFHIDLRYMRILRIFRLFRLLKFVRYISAFDTVLDVLDEKKEKLVVSFIFMIVLLIFSAALMYYVEHTAQPDVFTSIPKTLWWAVCTLTTIGYGDMYPVTPLGQFLGGSIALICVALFALPAGILASGFTQARVNPNEHPSYCPYCGKELPHLPEDQTKVESA